MAVCKRLVCVLLCLSLLFVRPAKADAIALVDDAAIISLLVAGLAAAGITFAYTEGTSSDAYKDAVSVLWEAYLDEEYDGATTAEIIQFPGAYYGPPQANPNGSPVFFITTAVASVITSFIAWVVSRYNVEDNDSIPIYTNRVSAYPITLTSGDVIPAYIFYRGNHSLDSILDFIVQNRAFANFIPFDDWPIVYNVSDATYNNLTLDLDGGDIYFRWFKTRNVNDWENKYFFRVVAPNYDSYESVYFTDGALDYFTFAILATTTNYWRILVLPFYNDGADYIGQYYTITVSPSDLSLLGLDVGLGSYYDSLYNPMSTDQNVDTGIRLVADDEIDLDPFTGAGPDGGYTIDTGADPGTDADDAVQPYVNPVGSDTPDKPPVETADPDDYLDTSVEGWPGLFGWLQRIWAAIMAVPANVVNNLKKAFAPSEELLTDIHDTVGSRFGWVGEIYDNVNAWYTVASDGEVEAPKVYIHLQDADSTLDYGGTVLALDLSWYTPYKQTVDSFLSSFFWLFFIWTLFKRAPDIIQGAGMAADYREAADNGDLVEHSKAPREAAMYREAHAQRRSRQRWRWR